MRSVLVGAAALAVAGIVSSASAGTLVFQSRLADHPDGAVRPPSYGMRVDNLFSKNNAGQALVGGQAGEVTFSFGHAMANMIVQVFDDSLDGKGDRIEISGVAYGGRDTGTAYGVGEGLYAIQMTFKSNVQEFAGADEGWRNWTPSAQNSGSITALTGTFAGESWDISDKSNGDYTFNFRRDGHRLGGSPVLLAADAFVGHGWMMLGNGVMGGSQDFLFVAVPTPTAGVLAAAGLMGLAGVRRRRMA